MTVETFIKPTTTFLDSEKPDQAAIVTSFWRNVVNRNENVSQRGYNKTTKEAK